MNVEENEGGGMTVILCDGDDLRKVPKSHRQLITAAIREAFANPAEYFDHIAKCCPFRKMSRWLKTLVTKGDWELELNRRSPKEWTLAGFNWYSEKVRGATIGLPDNTNLQIAPDALQSYYALVGAVHWNAFGCAGGLYGASEHTPLTAFAYDYCGDEVDPGETLAWGSSECGDMLIYTSDGRGGWLCHENGHIHLLGTIEETINWVYAELMASRTPQYDYRWA